jgi:hypothetical protein
MLAKYAQAVEIMRTLPDYDQAFLELVVVHALGQGLPGRPVGLVVKRRRRRSSPPFRRSIEPTPRRCGTAARRTRRPFGPGALPAVVLPCRGTD